MTMTAETLFVPIAESLPTIRPRTPVQSRRMKASIDIHDTPAERIAYQHTVLGQTCLPYRDPGEARIWERRGVPRSRGWARLASTNAELIDVGYPMAPARA